MFIGISGYARSGKDTICSIIQEEIGEKGVEKLSLADPIKNFVNEVFGWGLSHREGDLKEVNLSAEYSLINLLNCVDKYFSKYLPEGLKVTTATIHLEDVFNKNFNYFQREGGVVRVNTSPRKVYQLVGTEWARTIFGEDIFIQMVEDIKDPSKVTIVPDIRFENEVDWILSKPSSESVLIGVERNARADIGKNHASEQYIEEALLRVDYEINNNSNLQDLTNAVRYVLQDIESKVA